MSQPCGSEYHEESHLPLFTDLTKILAMDHEAGATDTTSVAQTANTFDANSDMTKLAQVAFGYRPKISQSSDMESVKALLRDLLDDVQEMERSSYFDGLLAQWLDIWRRDRTNSLLIYVLGDRSKQYGNCMLDFNNLEAIDTIKTRVLEQRCLQQGACIHLAKMTSAVNTDPHNTLELKMAISLHDIRDLSGTLLGNKPVAVGKESILQRKMLEERYHQQLASQNAYPSPTETTPSPPIDTAKSFQDWVSLSNVSLC